MADSVRIIDLEPDGSVPVTIVSGGGTGGTASSFGAAFPPTGTAAGFIGSGGTMEGANLDAAGLLKVNVAAGSSGNSAASATGAAVPTDADYQGINVAGNIVGLTGVNPSGTIMAENVDLASVAGSTVKTGSGTAAGAIRVELPTNGTGVVGIAAGTAVIGHVITDTGSTTAVTQATAASLNATVVGTGTFAVQNTAATPAGSNVIGHVITDTGSTTAVTGNVTVVQPTGTNLHAVLDSGTTTVTQATGTNLHAVIDSGTITTVTTVTGITNQVDINLKQVSGTNTVTAGVNGTQAVGGNVATNVAIGTNPINLGAQAVSAENTAVTATRLVQLVADLAGKLIVLPYANPENFVSGTITAAMTGTTTTSLIAAPASGLRNYITQITVSNASTTVPTDILIQDGSGGTTLYVVPAPAGTGTGTGAAGATLTFPTPLRQPTTATAIFVANVTTGSSTKVSASGYKGI